VDPPVRLLIRVGPCSVKSENWHGIGLFFLETPLDRQLACSFMVNFADWTKSVSKFCQDGDFSLHSFHVNRYQKVLEHGLTDRRQTIKYGVFDKLRP